MADLNIKKLSATLSSTSGTIAYADEIFDKTYGADGSWQQRINTDTDDRLNTIEGKNYVNSLGGASGEIAFENSTMPGGISFVVSNNKLAASTDLPILDVAGAEKVLSISNKHLETTLNLKYGRESSDDTPQIYLKGIDGQTVTKLDASPFLFTGENLVLSTNYAETKAQAPAAAVSLDAAMQYIVQTPIVGGMDTESSSDGFVSVGPSPYKQNGLAWQWKISPSVKTKAVSAATSTDNGLATAYDVQTELSSRLKSWTGTKAEYEALTSYDENTVYYVIAD